MKSVKGKAVFPFTKNKSTFANIVVSYSQSNRIRANKKTNQIDSLERCIKLLYGSNSLHK